MAIREYPKVLLGERPIFVGGWHARIFGIVVGLVGWYLLASVFPEELMPYPDEAFLLTWELVISGVVWTHLWATGWRILWGFLGSVVVGIALGVLMGSSRFGRMFITPYILVGLAIPALAWAAICLLIFGIGDMAPIVATVAVTFPFVAINVWKGVENIEADLISMSRSFGISWSRLLRRLIIPSTAGALMTAFRFGLAISWKIVTIAEMFSSSNGIGYQVYTAYSGYRFEQAWAWAIVFMIVILIIEYWVFQPLERRVFEYRQDVDFTDIG